MDTSGYWGHGSTIVSACTHCRGAPGCATMHDSSCSAASGPHAAVTSGARLVISSRTARRTVGAASARNRSCRCPNRPRMPLHEARVGGGGRRRAREGRTAQQPDCPAPGASPSTPPPPHRQLTPPKHESKCLFPASTSAWQRAFSSSTNARISAAVAADSTPFTPRQPWRSSTEAQASALPGVSRRDSGTDVSGWMPRVAPTSSLPSLHATASALAASAVS